jgi:hypothetical protein
VFRKGEDFHAGRNSQPGLPLFDEVENCGLVAARHPDGGGGIGRRLAACTGARAPACGLSHGGILNNVTEFNIAGDGRFCKANDSDEAHQYHRIPARKATFSGTAKTPIQQYN